MYVHKMLKCKKYVCLKHMCLEMLNKLVGQIVPLTVGSELLQEAIDAFTLLANANTEFYQEHGES